MLAQANKVPPFLCRLVARKRSGWHPMSCADIGKKAGLSKSYVASLSLKTSWKGVPIEVVERFSEACGVDLLHPQDTLKYLRESKMIFTKLCSKSQARFFIKLFAVAKSVRK
jgi:hypothetical protein